MKKLSLTHRILIAMVIGITLGAVIQGITKAYPNTTIAFLLHDTIANGILDAIGRIFVASLKLLVVPLVFVSLVCGTASLGENSRMGPIAAKTVGLYIITTCIAISIAIGVANLTNPGSGMGLTLPEQGEYVAKAAPPLKEVLVNIFPTNPFQAMAEGNMLQIIVFAILFGIAISKSGEHGERLAGWFNATNEVIMKLVTILMQLAPYGVFCLLTKLFSGLPFEKIWGLINYFGTVLIVLLIHGVVVYGTMLKTLARLSVTTFLKKMRPAQTMGFSTASSSATMPITMEVAEEEMGVDNSVAAFTIPLGATINMDGTAIMQGVATVFIAQAYGIDIGLMGYLTVILTATLASIGTAGVPGVGLITLSMVLQQVGLPVEGIAMIIGVDRLLDMVRTAINITGDVTVTAIVARNENKLNVDVFNSKEVI